MDNELDISNDNSKTPADTTTDKSAINSNNNNNNNNNHHHNSSSNTSGEAGNSSTRQQQQKSCLKGKPIAHRSQSSPSSLTTHKFGLRPTPSPPRLIIDHQTGDIIESYPEQPVYLRTYQPLEEDNHNHNSSNHNHGRFNDCDLSDDDYSTSQALDLDSNSQQTQSYPAIGPAARAANHFGDPKEAQSQQQARDPNQGLSCLSSGDESSGSTMGRNSNGGGRGFIPPPHANSSKVYFAPPMPSGGHLFHHDDYDEDGFAMHHQDEDPISRRNRERDRLQMNHHHANQQHSRQQPLEPAPLRAAPESINQQSGSLQSTFKRAISKLNEGSPKATTDIALVTHPDAESSKQNEIKITTTPRLLHAANSSSSGSSRQLASKQTATPVPASNQAVAAAQSGPAKVRYLSTTAEDNRLSNKRIVDHDPSVESFGLYSFCYSLRILLAILLSGLIVYLLIVPLNLDCTKYRPTYTYVSLIIASVNLICVTIFTLFWYCSGVTRTLYSNISSSAFIVTIYSILVAVNLAIAILFFLIGTCHFQRLISTPQSALSRLSLPDHGASSILDDPSSTPSPSSGETELALALASIESGQEGRQLSKRDHSTSQIRSLIARSYLNEEDDNDADSDTDQHQQQQQHPGNDQVRLVAHANSEQPATQVDSEGHLFETSTYTVSPWEAAWQYATEQTELSVRAFHRFLLHYDLRFIGFLHALCAICFQYLAIKVAVVRSYFCYSPVEGGDYV